MIVLLLIILENPESTASYRSRGNVLVQPEYIAEYFSTLITITNLLQTICTYKVEYSLTSGHSMFLVTFHVRMGW